MKKILILIIVSLFLTACTQYSENTFQDHPCDAPYSNNISCELARGCIGVTDNQVVLVEYVKYKCSI